ncbi:MAG: hypothetical protein EOP37_15370 [Rubrivivax sp.]|nr:MAG: hypothetical protein EOP37_15370 [Rubrivivax sp.]
MKRWARVMLKLLGGLLLGVVTLAAAWAAFNNRLVDDAPRPVPEALQVPAPTLPQEQNAFFALIGLGMSGDDPQAEGQRRWAMIDEGRVPAQELTAPRSWPSTTSAVGKVWQCDVQTQDCLGEWAREAQGLRALMDAHADIGRRCEAVARPGMAVEEPTLTPRENLKIASDSYVRRAEIFHSSPPLNCQRWLQIRAALAGLQGDATGMLTFARQADALTTAMLQGSRSLIQVQIAGTMARRQWRLLTDLAFRYPGSASALRTMVGPLPAQALDASNWIRTESQYGRETVREASCLSDSADPQMEEPGTPLVCESRFFAMPNATQRLMDETWMRAQAMAAAGPLALLSWEPQLSSRWWFGAPWRNSVGGLLVSVSEPAYGIYFRKQASLLLLNEAARLALAAGDVEPTKRAAWLSQQPMDARLRERLAIDGDHVVARVWEPVSSQDTLRYRIPSGVTSAATVTGSHPDPSPTQS